MFGFDCVFDVHDFIFYSLFDFRSIHFLLLTENVLCRTFLIMNTLIHKGKRPAPPRLVIYGPHKIGKSTFASKMPSPIFLPTEEGLDEIDTSSYPISRTYTQFLEYFDDVFLNGSEYKTLVIDSLDWLEKLIHSHLCEQYNQKAIVDNTKGSAFSFNRGYTLAEDEFRKLLQKLDDLRSRRGMAIVFLGHCQVKRFDSPLVASYDRYQLDVHKGVESAICEWATGIFFVNHQEIVEKEEVARGKTIGKGASTGERILYTEKRPAFEAGNRYGMPAEMPFEWDVVSNAIRAGMKSNMENNKE